MTTKTKEGTYDRRYESEHIPLHAAAPELLEAAKIGLEVVKEMIKDAGPCEHDVNICVCGYISYANQIEAAIAKAEGR